MLPLTWFVPGNIEKHRATGYGRALFCAPFPPTSFHAKIKLDETAWICLIYLIGTHCSITVAYGGVAQMERGPLPDYVDRNTFVRLSGQ